MTGPAYKPLRYSDVAEYLERAVKHDISVRHLPADEAAEMLTHLSRLPITESWVRVARGEVPRA